MCFHNSAVGQPMRPAQREMDMASLTLLGNVEHTPQRSKAGKGIIGRLKTSWGNVVHAEPKVVTPRADRKKKTCNHSAKVDTCSQPQVDDAQGLGSHLDLDIGNVTEKDITKSNKLLKHRTMDLALEETFDGVPSFCGGARGIDETVFVSDNTLGTESSACEAKANEMLDPAEKVSSDVLSWGTELDDETPSEKHLRSTSDYATTTCSPCSLKARSLSDRWMKIRPSFCRYLRLYRSKVEELAQRSISVERLLHFYHEVVIRTFNMDANSLTEDVVQHIIIPMTEEDSSSWVEYLERNTEYIDKTPILVPNAKSRPIFISGTDDAMYEPITHVVHAWKMRFVDLLAAVLLDASGGKTRKLGESYEEACRIYAKVLTKPYWICCFCINQHFSICQEPHFKCRCGAPKYGEAVPECEFDKFAAVAQALHQRGGGMVLALERDLQALSRAWCVDEVHYALATGMPIKPSFSTLPGFCTLREFECEVRRCQARPRDKDRILKKIQDGTGIAAFNERVTKFLQKEALILMSEARNRSRSVTRRRS